MVSAEEASWTDEGAILKVAAEAVDGFVVEAEYVVDPVPVNV